MQRHNAARYNALMAKALNQQRSGPRSVTFEGEKTSSLIYPRPCAGSLFPWAVLVCIHMSAFTRCSPQRRPRRRVHRTQDTACRFTVRNDVAGHACTKTCRGIARTCPCNYWAGSAPLGLVTHLPLTTPILFWPTSSPIRSSVRTVSHAYRVHPIDRLRSAAKYWKTRQETISEAGRCREES